MTFQSIYLDNNTLARPSEKCISSMLPFLTDLWGNPTAPHQRGQELYPALKESYRALYTLLGAKDEDFFILTSSGAEAVNHVFWSTYQNVTLPTGKNHFITSNLDEAPAILSLGRLESIGCVGKMVQADKEGLIHPEALAEAISPRTALVSLSWANGLTGVIQPINAIAQLCHQRGILLHLEATHVLGKIFFDLQDTGADFITFNGDQLHAPKGTGGLWVKQGIKVSPYILGGSDQAGQRAGSLNMPGLVGLATAAREALDNRDFLCTEIARLRDMLERELLKRIPNTHVLFQTQERLPQCTAVAFPGVSNEALLFLLNRKGLYACMGGGFFQQIGLLLTAARISPSIAQSAISFALSRYTTEEEIDKAVETLVDAVQQLRSLSNSILKPN